MESMAVAAQMGGPQKCSTLLLTEVTAPRYPRLHTMASARPRSIFGMLCMRTTSLYDITINDCEAPRDISISSHGAATVGRDLCGDF